MVKPMPATELDAILTDDLRWGNRTLGEVLGVDEKTVRAWRHGDRDTPAPIAAWLRKLAEAHRRHPPPPPPERPAGPGRPPGGALYIKP